MSFTLAGSGTTAALTIGSELTLLSDANNAWFQPTVDLTNMANGDQVELRIYMINLAAGSYKQVWKGSYANAQTGGNILSEGPPLASDQGWRLTIKQIAGTGRTFDWKVLRQ